MTTTASTARSMWMRIVFALSQSTAVPVLRAEPPARAVRPAPDGRVVPMMSELIECPRSLEVPQGEGAYQDEDDDRHDRTDVVQAVVDGQCEQPGDEEVRASRELVVRVQIGRASCRERVERAGGAGA